MGTILRDSGGYVVSVNLHRHMESWRWGRAFKKLLEIPLRDAIKQAVENGTPPTEVARVTFTQRAAEVGVNPETAKKRVRQADAFDAELSPAEQEQVRMRQPPQ